VSDRGGYRIGIRDEDEMEVKDLPLDQTLVARGGVVLVVLNRLLNMDPSGNVP
jgi:hypothetical protein